VNPGPWIPQFEKTKLAARDRERLFRLLKAALIEGEIERGRASEILGLQSTAARKIVRLAISEHLLESLTEKGPLALVFSADTLDSYFPMPLSPKYPQRRKSRNSRNADLRNER
jgi:hypothetical protein